MKSLAASAVAVEIEPDRMQAAAELAMEGSRLTAAEAATLENVLRAHPNDLHVRTKLLGYYFQKAYESPEARKSRQRHVVWIIQNQAEAAIAGLPFCILDPLIDGDAYVQARQMWLKQADLGKRNPAVLGNAAGFFLLHDRRRAEALLKAARDLEPRNPEWSQRLGQLYSLDMHSGSVDGGESAAPKALAELERASAGRTELERFYDLPELAKAAFSAGETAKASSYAREMLKIAPQHKGDWNYGNALHYGNLILGRIALRAGDVAAARIYLIEAARTGGSPQLNSFGPNMALAKELLEQGERKTVLQYLELCATFWESGRARLANWSATVRGGGVPDFGANLDY